MPSIDANDAALRHLLESDFHRLARGVTHAADVSAIVTHMVTAAQRIMYDLASDWNKRCAVYPLPDELLAASFGFLPLRDRITASHVSRAWRHAALAFPSVWCDIDLCSRTRDPAAVSDMMLSRAGQLPVSFSYRHLSRDPECHKALVAVIEKHLHHIASISWMSETLGGKSLTLIDPAPVLSSLTTDMYCYFPEIFLGGQSGSLRVLHVSLLRLPASCAAFSTVTDLRGSAPDVMDDNETLRDLFTLCPRLETLWLSNLRDQMRNHMPRGPAPPSLTRLRLSTMSAVCDHAARYTAWKTPALAHTELIYDAPVPEIASNALRSLFAGAAQMDVFLPNAAGDGAEIALRDAAGAVCRLRFAYPARDAVHHFDSLLGAVEFGRLRELNVDVRIALEVMRGLPREMERVTLRVHEVDAGRELHGASLANTHPYPLVLLACMFPLVVRCPGLASITVEVCPLAGAHTPSANIARNLRDLMATFGGHGIPDLHVRGFSRDVVREVEADPSVGSSGVKLLFETGLTVVCSRAHE